jgi:hypothetical protein
MKRTTPDGGVHRWPTRLEFVTTMRGHEVSCWLEGGCLHGDQDLLQRLSLYRDPVRALEGVGLAHLVGDAVGSDVVIRFADTERE